MTEAADGSVESVDGLSSKMQEEFSQIGVSITDANGQIRSTYDILTDIGAQWPKLTQNQKAYYAELAAGKNQANIFIALMDNIGTAVSATATAYDSAGSAAEENAKRMDSIQGHIEKFQAAWEKFTTSFADSDLIKNIIDMGTALVEFGTTDTGKAVLGLTAITGAFIKLKSVFSGIKALSSGTSLLESLFGAGSAVSTAKNAEKAIEGVGKTAKNTMRDAADAGDTLFDVFANIRRGADNSGKAVESVAGNTKNLAKAAGETAEEVAKVGAESTKAATSGGMLSKALTAIGGPTTLAIGASVLAIGGMVYAMDRASKAAGEHQDALVEDAQNTKKAYDNTTKAIETNDKRIAQLKETIAGIQEKGELTLVDEQNLKNAQRELSQLELQQDGLRKKQKRQQEENQRANERALKETSKISAFSGLGSLTGKDVTIPQEADEIIKAMSQLQASWTETGEIGKRVNEGTFKKQQEELENTRQRMIELREGFEVGSEGYDLLTSKISNIDNYLDRTAPLMERNVEAAKKYGNALVQMGDESKSVKDIATNLNDLTSAHASGVLSTENYISELRNGIDLMASTTEVAGYKIKDILNMSDREFQNLSSSEREQVLAAQTAWTMYSDTLQTTLENAQVAYDSTGESGVESFNTINDSARAALDVITEQEGLTGSIEEGWSGGSQAARDYANNLSNVIREMDSLSGAQDLVSESSDLMHQIMSDNINGMSTEVWEGTEAGKQALADFSAGAQTSLQELQDSNDTAWQTFKSTIEESTSGAYDALIDENGRLRDDIQLTGDQSVDVFSTLQSLLESDVPGAAEFAAGALATIGQTATDNTAHQDALNNSIQSTGSMSESAASVSTGAWDGTAAAVDNTKNKTGLLGGAFSTAGSQGSSAGTNIAGKFGEASGQIDGAKGSTDQLSGSMQGVGSSADGAKGSVGGLSDAINAVPRFVEVVFNVVQNVTKSIKEVFSGQKATGDDYIDETGAYLVGENGPELVTLPRGAGVANARETHNFRNMLRNGRGGSGGMVSIGSGASDELEKTAKNLLKATRTLNANVLSLGVNKQATPSVASSSTGGVQARAASYDDPHKKNFDAAYDELKYLQDMDRISEADYLNRLENLNNSYFGGRMEYLEEYRKYEVEVYKGRKKLQEQAERDREKAEKDRIQSVKDNFKKEEDALEYMRDKDLITEEEYYRQLAALNDKYYKGKTEFLDEYQKYEIKVYEYLKKKEEERLKELKEQTEKQYENTRDYIVDMIDEQIDAEDAKLDALDKEKEEQEKLQKIEEARKKLAEAQNQKVMVYRAGQGFVYESDAAAIEEANKELNDLLEEEKFDKQKEEIQAEIDRLEALKDAWEDSLDINEDLEKYGVLMDWIKAFEEANYEDRLNMAEKFGEEYRRILKEIEDAQAHVSDTASSQLPNFKPNGYARGTNYVQQNEKALVGENGPELVNLPKGSGVLTSDETKNMRLWGSISPVDMFSSIWKLLSDAPRFTFDTPNTAPSFDFSAWNVGVDFDSGLADAIKNNLQDTVIQYLSKRDR